MDDSKHFDGSQTKPVLQAAEQASDQHSILIAHLTAEVEHGNGCALRGVLRAMPFEESLKTLRDIEVKNRSDRSEDPSIPQVFFFSKAEGAEANGQLIASAGPNWLDGYNHLLKDSLALRETRTANLGERTFTCMDASQSSKTPEK
jgi:hypothetical protein